MTSPRIALCNFADFENALEEESRLFEALHPGVRVEIEPAGIHDLYSAPIAEGGLRDGRFDPGLLATDWLAERMDSRALQDLQPGQQRNPVPDWPVGRARLLVRPLIFGEALSFLPGSTAF